MTPSPDSLRLSLPDGRGYSLVFSSLGDVPSRLVEAGLRRGRCLVVTDAHVAAHYEAPLVESLSRDGWTPKVFVLPPGESSKAPGQLQAVYDAALTWGIDRKTPVLALGGGVVGDLAGFAAATLLRGVPLVQLPTTLIAQVDSAIGGKTGINHSVGKNLIGAFHQPHLVAIDLSTLATLPQLEWTSGLSEVVKHALIADADFLTFLENRWPDVVARRPTLLPDIVHRAAAIKVRVVAEDEREQGRRALLNFGHTFGHALEKVAGYGAFTHGEAVAVGMRAALNLSGRLFPDVSFDRAMHLVKRLPVRHHPGDWSRDALLDAMQADKKTEAGTLRLVVLRRPGEAVVTAAVSREDVAASWAFVQRREPGEPA